VVPSIDKYLPEIKFDEIFWYLMINKKTFSFFNEKQNILLGQPKRKLTEEGSNTT
jgi:hypothetical protein